MEGAGQADDLGGQAPLAGLQDPAFGLSEAAEIDVGEGVEGLRSLVKARLELAGRGAQGRDGLRAGLGHGPARVAHERLAGGHVGRGAPGGEEGVSLPGAQAMARDGVGQARLVAAREGRQGRGRGGGQPPGIDVPGHGRREPAAERQAAVHPAPTAAEQLGDLGGRHVVVVGQRAHHASLVHGTEGPAWGVGVEQARLAHHAGGVFDHRGHVGVAVAGPAGETLEPVQHLVGAVADRGHAQRERGERAGGIRARPPQRGERRGELRDREIDHEGHAGGASRGRSW